MIQVIKDNREAIEALCRRFHVARLEVFGSAVGPGGYKHIAGNIATEELVNMFHGMNVQTNIDLRSLYRAGEIMYDTTQVTGDFAPSNRLLREHLG
jgi:isopropylmalate/homocitrate/citramalate synthase